MKILLIFPSTNSMYGQPRYPPLGLSYIGAVLKKEGHRVRAIDMRLKGYDIDKVIFTLNDFKPHMVVITALSYTFKEVEKLAKKIKETVKTKVIVGGPHVGIAKEEVLKNKDIDDAFVGEGEMAILNAIKNKPVKPIEDLDSLPFPAFYLFPIELYEVRGKLMLPIMTSRGCPYDCIYCSSYQTFGKKFRKRSPENVVAELGHDIEEYGAKKFTIIDDIFSLDMDRAAKICDLIIENKLNIVWTCDQGIRADRVNKELLQKMKNSGCKLIAIGIESANQVILNNLNKNQDLETVKQTVKDAKEVGLIVKAFFLIGSPGETMENVKESIKFFKDNDIDIPRFSMLHPYPNTKLWDWMYNNATILRDPYKFVTEATHSEKVDVVYETKEFTREERLRAFKLAEEESEKWIIRQTLKRKLGKLGVLIHPIFTNKWSRSIIKFGYKLKLYSATD